jgi:LmbE family N-acetylglucosaminyl deacetylase
VLAGTDPAAILKAVAGALAGERRGRRPALWDGRAAERIVADLTQRMREGTFRLHRPEDYHLDIRRSYREDGL